MEHAHNLWGNIAELEEWKNEFNALAYNKIIKKHLLDIYKFYQDIQREI